jgi:hypothetical protein
VANVDGEFYPAGPGVEERIVDILGRQIASPVQFIKGLRTLFEAGARVFVETGPKRALQGFAADVLGDDKALNLFANHPKTGDLPSFNQSLCGLYASGLGVGRSAGAAPTPQAPASGVAPTPAAEASASAAGPAPVPSRPTGDDVYLELGHMFADVLDRGRQLFDGGGRGGLADTEPVAITGAAVGTPGTERLFDDANLARLLHGEQLIDVILTYATRSSTSGSRDWSRRRRHRRL